MCKKGLEKVSSFCRMNISSEVERTPLRQSELFKQAFYPKASLSSCQPNPRPPSLGSSATLPGSADMAGRYEKVHTDSADADEVLFDSAAPKSSALFGPFHGNALPIRHLTRVFERVHNASDNPSDYPSQRQVIFGLMLLLGLPMAFYLFSPHSLSSITRATPLSMNELQAILNEKHP